MHALLLTILAASFSPGEEIDRLLAAPHGLDTQQTADAVADCAAPDGWQMVVDWADPELLRPSKSPMENFKASNAFAMLSTLCGSKGADETVQRLREARKARDVSWEDLLKLVDPNKPKPNPVAAGLFRYAQELALIERQAMQSFAAQKNDALVKDLLPRVQSDTSLQLAMVTYFTAVARGDSQVAKELTTLRKSTNSKVLQKAIDAWFAP